MDQKSRDEKRAELLRYGGDDYRHMLDLDDEFPEVEMFGPQCISASVGPGWKTLLRPVLEVLRDNRCRVGQIKQKFGGLRVYWDFPDEVETALQDWHGSEKSVEAPYATECAAIRAAVLPVLTAAETLAWMTCETCGAGLRELREQTEIAGRFACDACGRLP